MVKIIKQFLSLNGYAGFNMKDVEMQMRIHPHYPSFKMVTDTLDYFSIENAALKVPLSILPELPDFFLTTIIRNNKEDIILVKRSADSILIIEEKDKKILSYDDFKKIWNPYIIVVEKKTSTQVSLSNFKIIVAIFLVGVLNLIFWNDWSIYRIVFFCLLTSGLILSIIALREELGYKSEKLNKLCNSLSSNCSEVIKAGKDKIFGRNSFSIAGIVFFSSLLIYSVFFGIDAILYIPLILAVFCSFYSLYLQAFIIRNWCVLCNSIILLVFVMAGSAIFFIDSNYTTKNLIFLLLITTISYFISNKIVQLEKENKNLVGDTYSLNQFKRDPEIFQFLYKAAPIVVNRDPIMGEIILGDPEGDFEIISLTNPFCGHCKKAFESYLRILKDIKSGLKIRLRFLVDTNNMDSPAVLICLKLHEIYNEFGASKVEEVYFLWFEKRDAESWLSHHGKPANNEIYEESLLKQRNWAVKEGLHYTPTTIINGHSYPVKYGYNELPFFTKELFDESLKNNEINVQTSLA